MPTWFPSYTSCSSPQGFYKLPLWVLGLITGTVSVGVLIAAALTGAWAPGVAAVLATACLAGITFCTWWLNVRLVCLGGDRSAVGAIYHLEPPTPSLDAFALGDYDTDYSFNLLLWPFIPQDELPGSFVADQWSASAEAQLIADWPTLPPLVPAVPFSEVQHQVQLILPQQSMANLSSLGFTGQGVNAVDEPSPQIQASGSGQHFLLHCEIEGAGIYQLRILLWALFALFVVAAALSLIPVIGSLLSWILSILAFLAFLFGGPAIQQEDASPPSGGGWGGSFNPYEGAASADGIVDLAYVFGRWVFDSFHTPVCSNELHPVHFMIKIGRTTKGALAAGKWPNLGDKQARLDAQFATISAPSTLSIQAEPQNQWKLHPVLDGCIADPVYPDPPPQPALQ